ncbi:hypothetical protein ACOAP1_04705 [Pseudomonas aeruginosa]
MNKANECTCPSGDGSLVHPCPAHPAEQAGGDERAAFEAWSGDRFMQDTIHNRTVFGAGYRAALAQPSPASVCATPAGENCPGDGVKSCKKCPEQPEAERPEVVGYRIMRAQADKIYQRVDKAAAEYEAGRSALGYMEDIAEAALCLRNRLDDLLAAPVAQAQHSVPGIAESVSECMALAQTVFARMEGLMPRGKKLPEKHVARRLLAELETLAKLAAAPAPGGE